MIRRIVRVSLPGAVVALGLSACATTEPGALPEPVVHETVRFRIVDYTEAPETLIDEVGARLEAEFDRVGGLLPEFTPPPTPITFSILPGAGIPYITPSENSITQWRDDLAPEYFAHQLTHLYTRYAQSPFIEEGLAVYVTEELQPEGETPNPFRAQSPHGWVSLYQEHESTILLATLLAATNLGYDYDGSSVDASAWQLFVEGGSFTRWLIEIHGRAPWHEFYLSGDPAVVLGQDLLAIQQAWLDHAETTFPEPVACEDALGTVGSRETFWCARARGE